MRGLLGGMLTGGLVSVLGLGTVSVMSEAPAGVIPPDAPLVEAPEVAESTPVTETTGPSTPVGSVSIEEPQAPALPEGEAVASEPDAPVEPSAEPEVRADTDPLDEPGVVAIEGAMQAPATPEVSGLVSEPVAPVLPNPQSQAPETPVNETDLTVSTAPAEPAVVVVPDDEETPNAQEDFFVVDLGADAAEGTGEEATPEDNVEAAPEEGAGEEPAAPENVAAEDVAVESDAVEQETPSEEVAEAQTPQEEASPAATDLSSEDILAAIVPEETSPRLQLQGGENTLLGDRGTGVTVRRPGGEAQEADEAEAVTDALTLYAAEAGETGSTPLMSIVLIDDGSMSAAAAALSGLPFPVTIALDPSLENAAELMAAYRESGFEIAVLAKLPEGAVPTDVEVTFESVFRTLPESLAVLDIGDGGLQADRAVTEQAMDILASQGRGFITASQGLNMAGRAAEQAGVPAAVVYRDLDADGQDARVVRRFVDQAAFRARQESGVVLVGRVRPDTISALILWGTANQDEQVAVVPVSAVLNAQ